MSTGNLRRREPRGTDWRLKTGIAKSECGSKKAWPDLKLAQHASNHINRAHGVDDLHAYACTFCGQFHIGHRGYDESGRALRRTDG